MRCRQQSLADERSRFFYMTDANSFVLKDRVVCFYEEEYSTPSSHWAGAKLNNRKVTLPAGLARYPA